MDRHGGDFPIFGMLMMACVVLVFALYILIRSV